MGDGAGDFAFFIAMGVVGASFFAAISPLFKAWAERISGSKANAVQWAEVEARLADLEARGLQSGEVEAAYVRLAEIEERVEFTERMLAQTTGQHRLGDAT